MTKEPISQEEPISVEHIPAAIKQLPLFRTYKVTTAQSQTREALNMIHTPKSWEDCYSVDKNGNLDLHYQNAKEYLYILGKTKGNEWKANPELRLAISKNPGEEEPYSLGIFTPLPSNDPKEKEKFKNNLKLLIKFFLVKAKCPEQLIEDLIRKLTKEYERKLRIVRQKHKEVRFTQTDKNGQPISLSIEDISRHYFESDMIMRQVGDNDRLTTKNNLSAEDRELYEQHALRLYTKIAKHPETYAEEARTNTSVFGETHFAPTTFFNLNEPKRKKETLKLMLFLHKMGTVQLDEITDTELIAIFKVINWSCIKAEKFLQNGEDMFKKMQLKAMSLTDEEETTRAVIAEIQRSIMKEEEDLTESYTSLLRVSPDTKKYLLEIDSSDILEDMKDDQITTLFQYALDRSNPMQWRNQAIAMAFLRLKFIALRLNPVYKHAGNVAQKLRHTITKKINWEINPDNNQFTVAPYAIYESANGNKSTQPDIEYKNKIEFNGRQWIAPISQGLSGNTYNIRIIDQGSSQKSKDSIVLKALLKNSKGEPENLFDLVRFTLVLNNIIDLNDPIVKKDIYYLLYQIGLQYGSKFKIKEEINWVNDDAETIFRKLSGRKELEKNEFTIEDRGKNGRRKNISANGFQDIKIVGKDQIHGTGFELQVQTSEDYCKNSSTTHTQGHLRYDERKIRTSFETIFAPHLFPRTWANLAALDLFSGEIYEKRFEANNLEKQQKLFLMVIKLEEQKSKPDNEIIAMAKHQLDKIKYTLPILKQEIQELHKRILLFKPLTQKLKENGGDLSLVEDELLAIAREFPIKHVD